MTLFEVVLPCITERFDGAIVLIDDPTFEVAYGHCDRHIVEKISHFIWVFRTNIPILYGNKKKYLHLCDEKRLTETNTFTSYVLCYSSG